MSSNDSDIQAWLSGINPLEDLALEVWDPGFDVERKVVQSKLGPYNNLFLCPPKFVPRFYHHIYPLLIEDWHLDVGVDLYGGFCRMDADLHVHFQATLRYAERNQDALSQLNRQIKLSYEGLIKDLVSSELRNLKDGSWVKSGLADVEKAIEFAINETLLLKQIQCRAVCVLKPTFEEFSDAAKLDGRFIQENVYLNVLQKNFEFREKQGQELFRQEEELDLQRLKHINQENEIQQQMQFLKAENTKRLLEEQRKQLTEQYDIEKRLHADKIKHEKQLQEIEQTAELEYRKDQLPKMQELELQMHAKKLQHDTLLKEKELQSAIKSQETFQMEWQKIQEHLEEEKLKHQSRLKEMQIEAELKELELRREASQNKDEYLRREIEWLVLDKQRAELTRAIKEAEKSTEDARTSSS
ncbi:MAG: hypothetical protein HOP23_17400 [Methylococcaceae bacterium]|nr:hypothetical protein [Methylococcaceae bacterium]